MRFLFIPFLLIFSLSAHADTIEHYMDIYKNIPQMEMKADPQSQAWARSARNVLSVTDETLAETLMHANEIAKTQGNPLFCLPTGVVLNNTTLSALLVKTYRAQASQNPAKNTLSVSQIAWLGVTQTYPCNRQNSSNALNHLGHQTNGNPMQHVNG